MTSSNHFEFMQEENSSSETPRCNDPILIYTPIDQVIDIKWGMVVIGHIGSTQKRSSPHY